MIWPSSKVGHLLSVAAFISCYALLLHWRGIAELFVDPPGQMREQMAKQAEAMGLVVAEFHTMMRSMSVEEFVPDLYSPEQYQFLSKAIEQYPHEHDAADILGSGPLSPGRAYWIMLSIAVGLFGGRLRARKEKTS